MKMNELKLVGLDMDGTLLGKDRILTQHTIDTLEKVAATGVHLVVDSGRKFDVVPKELRELPFMSYFVLSNGA
jgi:hydroxymethylpyrimidine pyrophosphatase-like HAD family hydrolase